MTMVKCVGCGYEMHYTYLEFVSEENEKQGLCHDCYVEKLKQFIREEDLWETFQEFVEKKTGIKNGVDLTD